MKRNRKHTTQKGWRMYMTYADMIRNMTDDELVEFLLEFDRNEIGVGYCDNECPKKEICEAGGEGCLVEDDAEIRWWLSKEVNVKEKSKG